MLLTRLLVWKPPIPPPPQSSLFVSRIITEAQISVNEEIIYGLRPLGIRPRPSLLSTNLGESLKAFWWQVGRDDYL